MNNLSTNARTSMFVIPFESGPLATIAYFIGDELSGDAIVIDAPKDSARQIQSVAAEKKLRVGKLLLTHSHWDHTADAAELKRLLPLAVCVHKADEYRMLNPGNEIIKPPFPLAPLCADSYLNDGDELIAGALHFQVLHTPGHTEGGVCFYDAVRGVLFSGDTLFANSVGRADLPGGNWNELLSSITTKLLILPDETIVYPGHGPRTTIGAERIFNPYLNGSL